MKFKIQRHCLRNIFGVMVFGFAVVDYAQELYVGANYHPHDSNPETWTRDSQMMQQAGIRVVRMGHLAWDSYEPKDGQFRLRLV